jgi:NAD(P)-dependent dehydrogenase (short-subunit alcohol dehydrogenase family)
MPVAIVTGASRGLGLAVADGLAGAGWSLVIDGRDGAALTDAATALRSRTTATVDSTAGSTAADRIVALPGDVSDQAHRDELAAAADRLGGIDLLVNNAGILGPSPQPALADYPVATLRQVYEINVLAPLALCQQVLPVLRQHGGAIVNITSDAAIEAYPGWGGYGSAKAALEQASRVLAAEEPAVRVWWVDPGDLRTRMHQEAFPGEDISDRPLPQSVVPALLMLLTRRPQSGRVRLAELAAAAAPELAAATAEPTGVTGSVAG